MPELSEPDESAPYFKECYGSADKFVARPGRKEATATENFYFPISYL